MPLMAGDAEDLTVISALAQDAVLSVTDIGYDPRHRQLALLLNRFRWEDADHARREGAPMNASAPSCWYQMCKRCKATASTATTPI